jgi:hypothetical protein
MKNIIILIRSLLSTNISDKEKYDCLETIKKML